MKFSSLKKKKKCIPPWDACELLMCMDDYMVSVPPTERQLLLHEALIAVEDMPPGGKTVAAQGADGSSKVPS